MSRRSARLSLADRGPWLPTTAPGRGGNGGTSGGGFGPEMKGLVRESHEIGDHARGKEEEKGRPDRDPEIEPETHPIDVKEIVIELAADASEIRIRRLEDLGKTG